MSKQAYKTSPTTAPTELYAHWPRPGAVMIQDAEGRFCKPAGSALVFADHAEFVQLTPEGMAALAIAQAEDAKLGD